MAMREADPVAAANYFRSGAWDRILSTVRERFVSLGRAGGTAIVSEPTPAEIAAVRAFLGRHPKQDADGRLRISMAQLETQLLQSRFHAPLRNCLAAYFGEAIITRPEQEAMNESAWQSFVTEVSGRIAAIEANHHKRPAAAAQSHGPPPDRPPSDASSWWKRAVADPQSATHTWLRMHWRPREPNDALLQAAEAVGTALLILTLGLENEPLSHRLPIFATQVTGDPHAFDPDRPAGRLLEKAIQDTQLGAAAIGSAAETAGAQREVLLSLIGLQRDDFSSSVLALGLTQSGRTDPHRARVWRALSQACVPVAYPLWEIRRWSTVGATRGTAYIVENPAVFAYLVEMAEAKGGTPPTLICTSGQLSAAAVALLDKLASSGVALYYGGDFDVGGLTIAAGICSRYAVRVKLWRMSVEDYRLALRSPGEHRLSQTELGQLAKFQPQFPDLVADMLAAKQKAYQEALVGQLAGDVFR